MKLQRTLLLEFGEGEELNFEALPSHAAVFAVYFDEAGEAAAPYLGRTSNLRRRLTRLLGPLGPSGQPGPMGKSRAESRLLNLRQQARRVEYSPVGSNFEALWLLYHLNKSYYPKTYRQRLRLKPPALLKLNIGNRFPRLYPTRRMSRDARRGGLYYGPFPSRLAAERFASEFLDFFKIRRCVEDLNPDPSHPGCIYSQMRMCLAPCFQGCTDQEYQAEVGRVVEFLDAEGRSLAREFEEERARASAALAFENAAKVHRKLEKLADVLRLKPGLARSLAQLNAVLVLASAGPKSAVFMRVSQGELRGPATLLFDENVSAPVSLDEQLRALLDSLAPPATEPYSNPPWEHLALLARWYYSSFRTGELVMLEPGRPLPTRALIRACRKVISQDPN